MDIDFSAITEYQRYKLMASLIVPRPIALVTTLGANGVVNAAPFSMFNMVGEEPPLVMLSINRLQDGHLKDTAANILASGEFVVHIADEAMAPQMHACGASLPPEVSELEATGLTPVPSITVKPPRIAEEVGPGRPHALLEARRPPILRPLRDPRRDQAPAGFVTSITRRDEGNTHSWYIETAHMKANASPISRPLVMRAVWMKFIRSTWIQRRQR